VSAASLPGWPHEGPAFHAGEAALQRKLGIEQRMDEVGRRVVRGEMPAQHRELFEKLPFLVLAALDATERPWATLAPGGARTPDARTLRLSAPPLAAAAMGLRLSPGDPVGLLGIELSTRRRNRANGHVAAAAGPGLEVAVMQSFGNCPKYIQRRDLVPALRRPGVALHFEGGLPAEAAALVARSDTLFIASAAPLTGDAAQDSNRGVDVSHRGGRPGFVRQQRDADGRTLLTLPDYAGNLFFNTLGNLLLHPWAGLLFVDWQEGHLLSLSVAAQLEWDGPALQDFEGAQRLLRLTVARGCWLPSLLPWTAGAAEPAPQFASQAE
jgi:predicted pyridoxine 5'-phosphate oxidase superfamily flavin-nucleotide-binding protein